jgi:hypothetical protein
MALMIWVEFIYLEYGTMVGFWQHKNELLGDEYPDMTVDMLRTT